jgi:hypothetical protein
VPAGPNSAIARVGRARLGLLPFVVSFDDMLPIVASSLMKARRSMCLRLARKDGTGMLCLPAMSRKGNLGGIRLVPAGVSSYRSRFPPRN